MWHASLPFGFGNNLERLIIGHLYLDAIVEPRWRMAMVVVWAVQMMEGREGVAGRRIQVHAHQATLRTPLVGRFVQRLIVAGAMGVFSSNVETFL